MAGEGESGPEGGPVAGQEGSLTDAVIEVQSQLMPLQQGEFSEKIGKISIYVQSSAKARDAKSRNNFIRFARLNLDAVLVQALEALVWRPKNSTKTQELKKATALQKTFDRLDNPVQAMREHFLSSSDPLNKYLVAGPWGHEYLKKRGIDLEDYDRELCQMLGCQETAAGKIVINYARLVRAIDMLAEHAGKSLP
ncbi:MAG: hypothetical protein JW999_03725 [Methanotrichaceae archaeon]|nr:hypothetical protein [Methanotrichaceae archaeon]